MLSFAAYKNGGPADRANLSGAYLVGSDDVALRAEITFKGGIIHCKKRPPGPSGLCLLYEVDGAGEFLLETVRLMEREKPYVLTIELARGRLLRLSQKIEDWGLVDYEGTEPLIERIREAKELLIKALQANSAAEAAAIGDKALSEAVRVSEDLTQFHAEVFFERRKATGGFPRQLLGCSVDLEKPTDEAQKRITGAFDYITVPTTWRDIEPSEQTFNWKPLDAWVELLNKQRIPIKGSALLSFRETNIPDWLYIWEHDFDTIRDLAFDHVRRVVNRYGQYVQIWDVISGIHATNCFTFNFEQLMELTRMAAALVKQVAPRSIAIVDLVAPWGEYYARNQRTIPPLLYADMAVQSGVNFDAFGLQFHFGPSVDGMFVRDMFQVSSIIDSFAKLGKPLHITGVQVPSGVKATTDASQTKRPMDGGSWHRPWDEQTQAEWLEEFYQIALSKPFVEAVSWHGLADHKGHAVAHGGLLSSGFAPKAAYEKLAELRSSLRPGKKAGEGRPSP